MDTVKYFPNLVCKGILLSRVEKMLLIVFSEELVYTIRMGFFFFEWVGLILPLWLFRLIFVIIQEMESGELQSKGCQKGKS
ncbi:hypothetical protein BCY86_02865 [Pajaroellobacter abortibovis]|uniref:Uncharacterized protein n=1 Tax=Pajaroellobacter abortibovis TaxID=1882918 RepID=A0A1L6MW26_9BACT|nr:hypothetical protein BCY86_02865 [Pajaroellobacter abortibovis]